MWNRWIASFLLLLLYKQLTKCTRHIVLAANNHNHNYNYNFNHNHNSPNNYGRYSSQYNQNINNNNLKISPKPCTVNGLDGTCMFVWECIKSEGQHVGMCMDSFMFGSCCSHNLTENYVLPQNTVSYHNILPAKPAGGNKTRPPTSNRPISSGVSSTIQRPHGAGTLVIRPPGVHITHQSAYTSRPTTFTSTSTTNVVESDLTPAASIPSGMKLK